MHTPLLRALLSMTLLLGMTRAAGAEPAGGEDRRWSVGTSLFMLANLLPDSGHFYYLEVDRSVSRRDALVFSAVTWTYHAPIGIPYGSSAYGSSSQDYPGSVRSVGLGVGWSHDLYRGLNVVVRSLHFLQRYEQDDGPTRTGYQLFLQTRLGWRLALGSSGLWFEPSIAFNWWPIETGRPASFVALDDRWPSYFLFEPWLNVGWSW